MLHRASALPHVRAFLLSSAVLGLLTGCHVTNAHDGNNHHVDIGTPFGSMQVKTDDSVAVAGVGVTPYPGAVVKKKQDDDDSAADVNLSFGSFHLGVKAVSYTTADAPDKVLAFYKKDLSRYGVVIQCRNDAPVGEPARTAEGLTCSDDHKGVQFNSGIQLGASSAAAGKGAKTDLRTGSKQRQHIVSIEPHDGGTQMELVALELPGNLNLNNDGKKSD